MLDHSVAGSYLNSIEVKFMRGKCFPLPGTVTWLLRGYN